MAPVRALFWQGRLTRAGIAALAAAVLALCAAGTATALTTQSSRLPLASRVRLPVGYNGAVGWSAGKVRLTALYVGGPDTFVRTAHWDWWTGRSAVSHGTLWVDRLPAQLRRRPLPAVPGHGDAVPGGTPGGCQFLLPDEAPLLPRPPA